MKPEKKKTGRRTFLRTTGMGNASLVLSAGITGKVLAAEATDDNSLKQMPVRVLGKTGVPVSILGLGGSIDPAGYPLLLRVALNMGINYWDSSSGYGNRRNEEVIGQFFSKYPEDRKTAIRSSRQN
jgi:uncharacterized protein